jgi:hypothetical protein
MRAVVVYESMYGNTRAVAEAVAAKLGAPAIPVARATSDRLLGADLVIVGGPTHGLSMSRPNTRKAAADGAAKPGSGLTLEPDATGPGVREWLAEHAGEVPAAAAFDTRIAMPAVLTGRASRKIANILRGKHVTLIAPPQSFLVTKQNQLLPGQLDRARAWAAELAAVAARK